MTWFLQGFFLALGALFATAFFVWIRKWTLRGIARFFVGTCSFLALFAASIYVWQQVGPILNSHSNQSPQVQSARGPPRVLAMNIQVSAPDGSIILFPEGTDQATVIGVMTEHFGTGAPKQAPGHYQWTRDGGFGPVRQLPGEGSSH